MRVGIVGLVQSGKTTLFKAITKGEVPIDEYGGKSNIGVVAVPDEHFDWLVEINHPKKITPATIEFVDTAAKFGEEHRTKLSGELLKDIQAADALLNVVRCYESPTGDAATPEKDARSLTEELILADLSSIETRLARIEKSLHGTKKDATTPQTIERDLLNLLGETMGEGKFISSLPLGPDQLKTAKGYDFLSQKPQIVVANIAEDEIGQPESPAVKELRAYCEESGIPMVVLSARVEAEVAELSDDEQKEFLEAMGLEKPARDLLINETYSMLGLISFYTAGEPEVKAYSITNGTSVVDAAGKIHSDLARGFIRAEIGHFDDVKAAGGWEEVKRAGKVELVMKDYTVQNGDIMFIRFKV